MEIFWAVQGMYAYNAQTRTAVHPVNFPSISKMHSHASSNCASVKCISKFALHMHMQRVNLP